MYPIPVIEWTEIGEKPRCLLCWYKLIPLAHQIILYCFVGLYYTVLHSTTGSCLNNYPVSGIGLSKTGFTYIVFDTQPW